MSPASADQSPEVRRDSASGDSRESRTNLYRRQHEKPDLLRAGPPVRPGADAPAERHLDKPAEPGSEPVALLIAALGGEGGGVLADWIVAAAQRAGLPVQATSVPGVAQRTGSTSYYLEFMRRPAPPGRSPVFALMPVPGRVDIVLASELMEAARTMERGFVTPDRTWLITAGHRVLTTLEKMAPGDGRFDDRRLRTAARVTARRCIELDLQGMAARHRTVISAVLYGALAGSGRLPWPRALDEAVIREGGLGVEASLAGYAEAYAAAAAASNPANAAHPVHPANPPDASQASATTTPATRSVTTQPAARIEALTMAGTGTPAQAALTAEPVQTLEAVLAQARDRLTDYQDMAYATLYAERVGSLRQSATASGIGPRTGSETGSETGSDSGSDRGSEAGPGTDSGDRASADHPALVEAARQLALWMSYEDVIRVADLKTRRERLVRLRAEVAAGADDVVRIHEHLKPGLDEIAAIAPKRIGLWLRARARREHPIGARGQGLTLETTSVRGFAMLRLLASLKRWRPISLRFAEEQQAIEAWLQALRTALPVHGGFALTLARMPQLRRGYSDTFERGRASYEHLFEALVQPVSQPDDDDAAALAAGLQAAQAMPDAAAPVGGPPRTVAAQPIRWHPRDSTHASSPPSGR